MRVHGTGQLSLSKLWEHIIWPSGPWRSKWLLYVEVMQTSLSIFTELSSMTSTIPNQFHLKAPVSQWVHTFLQGAYLGEDVGWWDGGWQVCKLSFGIEWIVFRPSNSLPGGQRAISGIVAVIHWLPHMWFEGSMSALGLSPECLTAGSVCQPQVLSLPCFTSRHCATVLCQGPNHCWVGPHHLNPD